MLLKHSLSLKVAIGMAWITAGTFASKLSSLGSQFVLGWLLVKEDFALYAIAISWASVVTALRNGGTQRILIQRGKNYDNYATIILKIALVFNVVALLILGSIGPSLARFYGEPDLTYLALIIGISLPLNTFALVFQTKLSIDLKFSTLSKINIYSSLLRHGSMVMFGIFGFGPLSFVLPLILVAIFETIIGWYFVGSLPPNHKLTKQAVIDVVRDSRWVMLGSLAAALILNGDYIVIGFLEEKETLSSYFFGFQLVASIAAFFTMSIEGVVMPIFSQLVDDLQRQKVAFLKSVRVLSSGTTLVCFAIIISADPLINFLWNGKWNEAIPVVQLFSLSLFIRSLVPLAKSLLEAHQLWKLASLLSLVDGLGTILSAAIGCWFGDLIVIAATVSGYRVLFGLFYYGLSYRIIGGQIYDVFTPFVSTLSIGVLAAIISVLIAYFIVPIDSNIGKTVVLLGMYGGSYVILTSLFCRQVITDLKGLYIRQSIA
jgi:O-antigen/teichoic acid export membrane protein